METSFRLQNAPAIASGGSSLKTLRSWHQEGINEP
jgi:hypothetical protein